MTAARTVRTPPRFVIGIFWVLHRALHRFSGGRLGLSQPEAGERFGMMRLDSVGRRSGKPRVAIIGYYMDGPDLVTLAMNGWVDRQPAWWLNLQAGPRHDGPAGRRHPLGASSGARGGRARPALGEFHDFPGWGDDLDDLAEQRGIETAVVVLEPRGDTGGVVARNAPPTEERTGADADDISLPAPAVTQPESRATAPRGASAYPGLRRGLVFRPTRRHLWLVPGLAIGLYASVHAANNGVDLVPLLVFGIVPHLTVLLGWGQAHANGQLAPRAVPLFNAMHHPLVPLALLGLAATGLLSAFWLVGALAWLSHIVVDWALGDGIRDSDGFRRGYLTSERRLWRGAS